MRLKRRKSWNPSCLGDDKVPRRRARVRVRIRNNPVKNIPMLAHRGKAEPETDRRVPLNLSTTDPFYPHFHHTQCQSGITAHTRPTHTRLYPRHTLPRPARSADSTRCTFAKSATRYDVISASPSKWPVITAPTACSTSHQPTSEATRTGRYGIRAPSLTPRCARSCFACPHCTAALQVIPAETLDPSTSRTVGAFLLTCPCCKWSSREVGWEFEKATGIAREYRPNEWRADP